MRKLGFVAILLIAQVGWAATTWTGGGADNNWSTDANWADPVLGAWYPSGGTDVVFSGTYTPVWTTANMDVPVTVGSMTFNTPGGFAIGGASLLTGNGVFSVTSAAAYTISAGYQFPSINADVITGGSLTLSATTNGGGGTSFTKTGGGLFSIQMNSNQWGNFTFNTIDVLGGTAEFVRAMDPATGWRTTVATNRLLVADGATLKLNDMATGYGGLLLSGRGTVEGTLNSQLWVDGPAATLTAQGNGTLGSIWRFDVNNGGTLVFDDSTINVLNRSGTTAYFYSTGGANVKVIGSGTADSFQRIGAPHIGSGILNIDIQHGVGHNATLTHDGWVGSVNTEIYNVTGNDLGAATGPASRMLITNGIPQSNGVLPNFRVNMLEFAAYDAVRGVYAYEAARTDFSGLVGSGTDNVLVSSAQAPLGTSVAINTLKINGAYGVDLNGNTLTIGSNGAGAGIIQTGANNFAEGIHGGTIQAGATGAGYFYITNDTDLKLSGTLAANGLVKAGDGTLTLEGAVQGNLLSNLMLYGGGLGLNLPGNTTLDNQTWKGGASLHVYGNQVTLGGNFIDQATGGIFAHAGTLTVNNGNLGSNLLTVDAGAVVEMNGSFQRAILNGKMIMGDASGWHAWMGDQHVIQIDAGNTGTIVNSNYAWFPWNGQGQMAQYDVTLSGVVGSGTLVKQGFGSLTINSSVPNNPGSTFNIQWTDGALTLNTSATIALVGGVSSNAAFAKNGSGLLIVNAGPGTRTAGWTINAGTLAYNGGDGSQNGLGTGTVTVGASAVLNVQGTLNNPVAMQGKIVSSGAGSTFTNTVDLFRSTVQTDADMTVTGLLTVSGYDGDGLTKAGAGKLIIASSGTLQFNGGRILGGQITLAGGTMTMDNSGWGRWIDASAGIEVPTGQTGTLVMTGAYGHGNQDIVAHLTGGGVLVKKGNGSLMLTGTVTDPSGASKVNWQGGDLYVGNDVWNGTYTDPLADFELVGGIQSTGNLLKSQGGTLFVNSGLTNDSPTYTGTVRVNGGTLAYDGGSGAYSAFGTGTIVSNRWGILKLSGTIHNPIALMSHYGAGEPGKVTIPAAGATLTGDVMAHGYTAIIETIGDAVITGRLVNGIPVEVVPGWGAGGGRWTKTGPGNLTVTGGLASLNGSDSSVYVKDGRFTWASASNVRVESNGSGNGVVTVNGPGTVDLYGFTSTTTQNTVINGGTLIKNGYTDTAPFGTGKVVVNGSGVFNFASDNLRNIVQLNGGTMFVNNNNWGHWFAAGSGIEVPAGQTGTLNMIGGVSQEYYQSPVGNLSGDGVLTKAGDGTMTLKGTVANPTGNPFKINWAGGKLIIGGDWNNYMYPVAGIDYELVGSPTVNGFAMYKQDLSTTYVTGGPANTSADTRALVYGGTLSFRGGDGATNAFGFGSVEAYRWGIIEAQGVVNSPITVNNSYKNNYWGVLPDDTAQIVVKPAGATFTGTVSFPGYYNTITLNGDGQFYNLATSGGVLNIVGPGKLIIPTGGVASPLGWAGTITLAGGTIDMKNPAGWGTWTNDASAIEVPTGQTGTLHNSTYGAGTPLNVNLGGLSGGGTLLKTGTGDVHLPEAMINSPFTGTIHMTEGTLSMVDWWLGGQSRIPAGSKVLLDSAASLVVTWGRSPIFGKETIAGTGSILSVSYYGASALGTTFNPGGDGAGTLSFIASDGNFAVDPAGHSAGTALAIGTAADGAFAKLLINVLSPTSYGTLAANMDVSGLENMDLVANIATGQNYTGAVLTVMTYTNLTGSSTLHTVTLSNNYLADVNFGSTALTLSNIHLSHIAGDINGDNIVDQADYTVWYNHYGQSPATWADGDVTGDNIVDQADYTVWYNNYGSGGSSVPEPMTMALLAIGGLTMLRRRK